MVSAAESPTFSIVPGTAFADTIYVDQSGGGNYLTIQEGVDAPSGWGDIVLVAPGTYVEHIDLAGCPVLTSEQGAEVNPGQEEIPGNGIDDDCDGRVDEGCFVGSTLSVSRGAKGRIRALPGGRFHLDGGRSDASDNDGVHAAQPDSIEDIDFTKPGMVSEQLRVHP